MKILFELETKIRNKSWNNILVNIIIIIIIIVVVV